MPARSKSRFIVHGSLYERWALSPLSRKLRTFPC
ncbi:Uncharacterised protein [Vibrio cholerae]|nr:Uncharacterised protein [Vibrio cholerae]